MTIFNIGVWNAVRHAAYPKRSFRLFGPVDVVPHETYLTLDGLEAVKLLLNDRVRCRAVGAVRAAAAPEWDI